MDHYIGIFIYIWKSRHPIPGACVCYGCPKFAIWEKKNIEIMSLEYLEFVAPPVALTCTWLPEICFHTKWGFNFVDGALLENFRRENNLQQGDFWHWLTISSSSICSKQKLSLGAWTLTIGCSLCENNLIQQRRTWSKGEFISDFHDLSATFSISIS